MEHNRIKPSSCPHCNYLMDAAFSPGDESARPNPGDLTICINCAEILQFDADLMMQKVPDEIMKDIQEGSPEQYEQLKQIRMAVIMLRKKEDKDLN